jgi:hypothetical protein
MLLFVYKMLNTITAHISPACYAGLVTVTDSDRHGALPRSDPAGDRPTVAWLDNGSCTIQVEWLRHTIRPSTHLLIYSQRRADVRKDQ